METEGSPTTSQGEPSETRIVVLVLQPNGEAYVKTFTRIGVLPEEFVLKDSKEVDLKKFKTLPKRLAFFFEKGFSL